jgi:hypothetical protein
VAVEEEQALVVEVWEDPAVVGEEQASVEELVGDLDPADQVVADQVVADQVVADQVVADQVVADRVVADQGAVVLVAEPEGVPGKVENQASG